MIKINKGFLKGSFQIVYCIMINDKTFIISPFITKGYQGFSPNIYYNIDSKVIQVFDRVFDVIEVTPDYIIIAD